jgi:hypothetical protein
MIRIGKPKTTPAELIALIDYNPLTGKMRWKPRPEGKFCSPVRAAA